MEMKVGALLCVAVVGALLTGEVTAKAVHDLEKPEDDFKTEDVLKVLDDTPAPAYSDPCVYRGRYFTLDVRKVAEAFRDHVANYFMNSYS